MELLQLRYFYESAKNQSFSKTSEKYMVPLSSVSASIKRLEQEIKTDLFLSDYENFMNDKYSFNFTVTIHAEAEWIDRWWIWEKDEYEKIFVFINI